MRDGVLLCDSTGAPPPFSQLTATSIACQLCSSSAHLGVSHDVKQCNNVGAASQVLQDLDLSLDLLLLHRLENLDDAFLVVDDVDAFENLGVFSSTCASSD